MFRKLSNRNMYLYKKSYLNRRLEKDVMEDGIAYIPVKVESINDIISRFSVRGLESLNSEFMDYIMDYIDFIPSEFPVVLEIHGPEFSRDEKKVIIDTVQADMDYLLGRKQEEIAGKRKKFIYMLIGTIVSGTIFSFVQRWLWEMPLEFFYVVFWLFADAFVRYIFIEKTDYNEEKIRYGRLASMKVEFVEQG
ncbi:MAG: hypothetical protein K6F99_08250 [Lachnospiraceae bacterium]|nr:hypothetical protein [Lachnospiraceae bacterium]